MYYEYIHKTLKTVTFKNRFICEICTDVRSLLYVLDFAVKTVDTGSGNLETRCLPMLQLICLDIREVDFTSYIMHNATLSANT